MSKFEIGNSNVGCSGKRFHKHKCPDCETVWEHTNACADGETGECSYDEAHSCPQCGAFESWKFGGDEPPTITNGLKCYWSDGTHVAENTGREPYIIFDIIEIYL